MTPFEWAMTAIAATAAAAACYAAWAVGRLPAAVECLEDAADGVADAIDDLAMAKREYIAFCADTYDQDREDEMAYREQDREDDGEGWKRPRRDDDDDRGLQPA